MRMMRQPILEVAGGGVDLTHAMTDHAVRVVIQVGTRRRDAVDEPALDERNEATLVKPGRRHRSAERQKDGAIPFDASTHELVGGPLLPADVGRESLRENLMRRLVAGNRPGA